MDAKLFFTTLISGLFLPIMLLSQNQYSGFSSPLPGNTGVSSVFGEPRADHFHSGIDFRTNSDTGMVVVAPYDGWVSRIKIGNTGYGNTVYIDHPNGYTTVYGHLERFSQKLEQYVDDLQYQQQKWDIEDFPNPNQICIQKGDTIGYSGNTGGSTGPHMNEYQVTIGETTYGGKEELHDTTAIVDYGSLIYLALQRSKTAREAIKVMAELVAQYGYASEGESFSIGDPNEVWILEIIGKGTNMPENTIVKVKESKFLESDVFLTDSLFFNVFEIAVNGADPKAILGTTSYAYLSENTAKRYFGNQNAIGQVIEIRGKALTVAGTFHNFPANSHFHPEVITNLKLLFSSQELEEWGAFSNLTYIRLKDGSNVDTVQSKIRTMFYNRIGKMMATIGVTFTPYLQPITDIHLRSSLMGEIEPNGDYETIYIFSVIAFLILLIAIANYMNLSTARFSKRAKEVGIRKVSGARRGMLSMPHRRR